MGLNSNRVARRGLLGCAAAAIAATTACFAAPDTWDVTRTYGQVREVDFFTDEGTDLSVDTAPDGRWIVFDLLGNLYRVSTAGGDAELLTRAAGQSVNYHPRYSPDGAQIAFVSDRGGQNNLWIMDADGGRPRPVAPDLQTRFTQPAWSHDGKALFVTKVLGVPDGGMERRILQLWRYSIDSGAASALVAVDRVQAEWPTASPDGRYVYFESSIYGDEEYTAYHIERLDLGSGKREPVTRSQTVFRPPTFRVSRMPEFTPANDFAPELSPDGRYLAFARRIPGAQTSIAGHLYKDRTALWLRDLQTGEERVLMDPIDPDRTGTYARGVLRPVNGYAWMKDGRSLIVPVNGKLRRVEVDSGRVTTIPFRVHVQRQLSQMARAQVARAGDAFESRFLQWPTASPDGRRIAFYAAGQIWVKERGNPAVRPLLSMPDRIQLMPAWSPDGRWIAFVTWKDGDLGQLWKIPAAGGRPIALTHERGEFLYPAWSPDGKQIAVTSGSLETLRGDALSANLKWYLRTVPAKGGAAVLKAELPSMTPVSWNNDGRLYYLDAAAPKRKVLSSINGDGDDLRRHALFTSRVDQAIPSADGRRVVYHDWFDVYVADLPPTATAAASPPLIDHYATDAAIRASKLSADGGWYPIWRGSNVVEYFNGADHHAYDVALDTRSSETIRLAIPRHRAAGTVALTGATLLSMARDQAARVGTIVLENGRIRCVFECSVSGAQRVIDVSGKFIMPGLVDVHDHNHMGSWIPELASRHHPHSALQLAYGVTTAIDPYGVPTFNPFMSELIQSGRVVGPRSFYTSFGVHDNTPEEHIETYEDAVRTVSLYAHLGAIGIKNFHQTNRRQSQMLSVATQSHGGMYLTAEQSDLPYVVGLILDGHTGWEHMLSYDTLHNDVSQFVGQAGATYSPTLIVGGLHYWGSEYFVARYRPWEDAKFTRFIPWQWQIAFRSFGERPQSDFAFPFLAEGVAAVLHAGGNTAIGGHGEVPGMGAHFEMQMYASALEPLEVLRMATLGGARFTGIEADVGSLEPGKLADLLVLNSDPTANIRNTLDLRYVMKDGVLYDAATLDELWPKQIPFDPVPWKRSSDFGPRSLPLEFWDK